MTPWRSILGTCALGSILSVCSPAFAGPTVITMRPELADGAKVQFLVGGAR